MKYLFFTLSLLLISGCASVDENLVLNGKSAAAFENDINTIMQSLPRRKRQEFMVALRTIEMNVSPSPLDVLANIDSNTVDYELLSQHLDGLTYNQVLERASKSRIRFKTSLDRI